MTQNDIDNALNKWKSGLLEIAKLHKNGGDYKGYAQKFIKDIYDYDNGTVLFKPTLAAEEMFRGDLAGAVSYFVSGNDDHKEDKGFAIKDWEKAEFDNTGYIIEGNIGIVMGNKNLLLGDGTKVVANYTMVFRENANGELKIIVHHSSLPFTP